MVGAIALVVGGLILLTAGADRFVLAAARLSRLWGLSPILIGAAFSCSLAMALPISTPPNAMAFSTGVLEVKDILRTGLPSTLIGLALTFSLFYWWWGVLGLR